MDKTPAIDKFVKRTQGLAYTAKPITSMPIASTTSQPSTVVPKQNNGVDLDAVNLARAIRDKESGGNYNAVGDAGTSRGAFQFQDSTWRAYAKDVLGNPNAKQTPENQNAVAYGKIKEWKDSGLNVAQIAAKWNSGSEVGWENKKGFNKKIGLSYDVPAYVEDVIQRYQTIKSKNPTNVSETVKETVQTNDLQIPRVGSGNIPGIKQLSDIGTGIGAVVGETALNALKIPVAGVGMLGKLVDADFVTNNTDKLLQGIESVKENVYQKPFEEQRSTLSGQAGEAIGLTAPYLATAGVVNPLTSGLSTIPRIGTRALSDVAVSLAQTGGDLKASTATGVASAIGDALLGGKAQAVKGFIPTVKQIGGNALSGYASDVSSGVAGMRGEDRTGVNALIPGGGTAIGTLFGTTGAVSSKFKNPKRERLIQKAEQDLVDIENSYAKTRKNIDYSKDGLSTSRRNVLESGVLNNAVDENGVIRTTQKDGAVDLYEKMTLDDADNLVYKLLEREGSTVKPTTLAQEMRVEILADRNITGANRRKALNSINDDLSGFSILYKDSIPLTEVQNAKIASGKTVKDFATPADYKAIEKAKTRAYKNVIEKYSSENISEVNQELSKYLKDIEYLRSLDGKRVKGGRLGRYSSQLSGQLIGAFTGTAVGGPVGGALTAVVGGELASALKSRAFENTFKKFEGVTPKKSNILKTASDRASSERLALPTPRNEFRTTQFGYNPIELPAPYSKSLGSRNTMYDNISNPKIIDIVAETIYENPSKSIPKSTKYAVDGDFVTKDSEKLIDNLDLLSKQDKAEALSILKETRPEIYQEVVEFDNIKRFERVNDRLNLTPTEKLKEYSKDITKNKKISTSENTEELPKNKK